jgi:hypothetical protein
MDRKAITTRYREKNRESLKMKSKEYREKNKDILKEKNKEYKDKNKEIINNKSREYRKNNLDKEKKYRLEYRKKNKDILKLKSKEYRERHKDYYRTYRLIRKKNDILYFLKLKCYNIIYKAIKHKHPKNLHTLEILGCTYAEFKSYIENQFEPWMNWENYGLWNGELNYGWDIDHIIPITSATTEKELIELNHYLNLRPLCSHTNRYIKKNFIQ